jgi:hypothetical protein
MNHAKIAEFIGSIDDYANFVASSKIVKQQCRGVHQKNIDRLSNHLWNIIRANYKKLDEQDWRAIGCNPSIPWAIIKNNTHFPDGSKIPWDYRIIQLSGKVTNKIIFDNLDRDWDWYEVVDNHNDDNGEILRLLSTKEGIDRVTSMDMDEHFWRPVLHNIQPNDLIIRNQFKPLDWGVLGRFATDLDWDLIDIQFHKFRTFENRSRSRDIKLEDVLADFAQEWDWSSLSKNKYITIENILKNIAVPGGEIKLIPWDWKLVSLREDVTFDIIVKNLRFLIGPNEYETPWEWEQISQNKNITIEIIKNNLHAPDGTIIPWDSSAISSNPNLTWKIVKLNPDHPWDLSKLSSNIFDKLFT